MITIATLNWDCSLLQHFVSAARQVLRGKIDALLHLQNVDKEVYKHENGLNLARHKLSEWQMNNMKTLKQP